jgi:arylsulfatase A-like enzyme
MNFALARELIEREGLGDDAQPDLLWLGASASDWIGHRFGPRSHEMEAHHLELDRLIGEFLAYLDARFPQGDYLVVLTSDHGVADVPESTTNRDQAGARVMGREAVKGHLGSLGETGACPKDTYDFDVRYGVTLTVREGQPAPAADVRRDCARALAVALRGEDWAVEVLGPDELEGPPSPDDSPYAKAAKLSFYPGRAADVFVRLPEHHMFERGYTTGTSHGSAYTYDQRVPLIFFSPRLEPAVRDEEVQTVDLAPTLAPLLDAPIPPSLPGSAISSMGSDFRNAGWPSDTGPQ